MSLPRARKGTVAAVVPEDAPYFPEGSMQGAGDVVEEGRGKNVGVVPVAEVDEGSK